MIEINTKSGYGYKKLFDAVKDNEKRYCETVGEDESGNIILHKSYADNSDNYCVLDSDEYIEYLEKAKRNKLITFFEYRKLLKRFAAQKSGRVESVEIITLRLSGMRYTTEYEILTKDGKAEVSEYGIRYNHGDDVRVLEEQVVCDTETVLKLLNGCGFMSWDGFDGPHPKGVLDGTMFRLDATVNGNIKIHARGSQNFPKHFSDFRDGLHTILHGNK